MIALFFHRIPDRVKSKIIPAKHGLKFQLKKKVYLFLVVLLLTAIVFSACATEDEQVKEAEDIEYPRGIFYEVKGGENTLYLFGSIHFGYEDLYPLHDKIYDAFYDSDVLGLELDIQEVSEREMSQKIAEIGMFKDERKMSDVIGEEMFDEIIEVLEEQGILIEAEALNQFQPWYANMLLSEVSILEAGYEPKYGIERYLVGDAYEEEMDTLGLETVESQLTPYNKLSEASQKLMLENSLEELERVEEDMEELISAWKVGDEELFASEREKMIAEAETESLQAYQEAFLDGRDEQMTEEIISLLEDESDQTYFITVGTLHLVGENSIVDRLERADYEVESMF